MNIQQIYTDCLSQAAYYIESKGELAIIDPLRDISAYIEKANESGHQELSKLTGAEIIFGPTATTKYDSIIAKDERSFSLGDCSITTIHTPGHTMESTTWLLKDPQNSPTALFTGDRLFLGDVGRPDLAVQTDLSLTDLAKHLYNSIYKKLCFFEDDITIYPGHGASSACGKKMSKDTIGTLGAQKATNYALQNLSEEIFVQQVTSGLTSPPQYFPKNAQLYKMGTSPFTQVNEFSSIAHCPNDFEKLATPQRPLILDTRSPLRYRDSFIPNSINIGLDGKFDSWVGTLVNDLQQKFLLVCEPGTDTVKQITANELTSSIINPHILDDRNTNEYNSQHLMIEHLQNIPFELLSTQMDKVKSSDNL